MTELNAGAIGPEANYKIDLEGGMLKITANYKGTGGDASLSVNMDAGYFLDELAKKIPGQIDNAVFGLLKVALKQV